MDKPLFKFEKLIIWQKAMDFGENVFETTLGFPKEELYSLTSQYKKSRGFNRFKYCRRINWSVEPRTQKVYRLWDKILGRGGHLFTQSKKKKIHFG